jgi:hypothetical protein
MAPQPANDAMMGDERFFELPLSTAHQAVTAREMTPVQTASLPAILAGR